MKKDIEKLCGYVGKSCRVRGCDKVCTITALHIYINAYGVKGVRVSVFEYREYSISQWHNIQCVEIL